MMTLREKLLHTWHADELLRRVLKNSSYLFSSSTLGIVFSVVSSALAVRTLGAYGFGVFAAVLNFAGVADKLFSFRIGELVIKYTGQALAQGEKERAAAVFKTALLTELLVSILSYILIVLLAPLAALYFAKDASLAPMFMLYGLIVPAGFGYETFTALLQIGGRYRSQAALNLAHSLVTAGLVLYAYLKVGWLTEVLIAYLAGKTISGLGLAVLSFWRAGKILGPGWWRASFRALPPPREFWGFAFSSNFSGTVNLFVRDSDILWINLLLSPIAGGYYKIAITLIGFMTMPVDSFIKTSFPEISKMVAERAWGRLKNLLRRLTLISGGITLAFGAGLLFFGGWAISLLYTPQSAPALVPTLILFLGYGFANLLFWNRPLILALGHPTYPLVVTILAGLGKIALSLWLVPLYGINAQAALMSAYFIISIGLIAGRGLAEIRTPSPIPTSSKP